MKTPKVDKSPKIVKRPRGRPPLNPKPEHSHQVAQNNVKKVHGNVKKVIETTVSKPLVSSKLQSVKSSTSSVSSTTSKYYISKKSILSSSIPARPGRPALYVPSKLLASTATKGIPSSISSHLGVNSNTNNSIKSISNSNNTSYGNIKSQISSSYLSSSSSSSSFSIIHKKGYHSILISSSSNQFIPSSSLSSYTNNSYASNMTAGSTKIPSAINPSFDSTSSASLALAVTGKLTAKESKQTIYPVHRVLYKLMIDEPLSITTLQSQLVDIPKEIIQATLDVLQVFGLVIRVRTAAVTTTTTTATGATTTTTATTAASNAPVATKEANLLYTMNHHAKSSEVVDITDMARLTAEKRNNATMIRARNQALYVSYVVILLSYFYAFIYALVEVCPPMFIDYLPTYLNTPN